jgi:hypothetical protein
VVDMTDLDACQNVDPEADIVALDQRHALVGLRFLDPTQSDIHFDWKVVLTALHRLMA